jgi:ABC-type branched-subunit amino acid transport system permease subunit
LFTTINIQIYAILGGIGYPIAGPLVGSAIMTFFPEFIRVAREVGPVFTGAMLVLVIMLLPNGVVSLMEKPKDAVEQITKIGKILKAWLLSRREKENRYTPS